MDNFKYVTFALEVESHGNVESFLLLKEGQRCVTILFHLAKRRRLMNICCDKMTNKLKITDWMFYFSSLIFADDSGEREI